MDVMVQKTQEWLDMNYSKYSSYTPVDADGVTGWPIMKALTTALQIELKIESPTGTFGPATRAAFQNLSINSKPASNSEADVTSLQNKIYILQGALFCKGYNPTAMTGTFGPKTEAAVKQLQADAGIAQTGIVDATLMKALLTMDAFTLLQYGDYQGDTKIRSIQQALNGTYGSNSYFSNDIGLVPCDGLYGRATNRALIYAIQIEEGISEPTGFVGSQTKAKFPYLSLGVQSNAVKILQYALYCYDHTKFDPTGFTGYYGNGTQKAVLDFQNFTKLTTSANAGTQTWCSLLTSTGDNTRKGTACDCATTITSERAITLKNNGYKLVGRYLTGNYAMTPSEVQIILSSGLSIYPIFEIGGNKLSYFRNEYQGSQDAKAAIRAASALGFDAGTIIYFAVDFDALDGDVTSSIIPYFSKISETFKIVGATYKIGIYGPRNVCSRVSKAGYSCSSFACDMSTGFSGNLGYPLPDDWAIDQISTITLGSGTGAIEIDNDINSGKDPGTSSINPGNGAGGIKDPWEPKTKLAYAVSEAGFLYDPIQDIIYSEMDPLQRDFGYCKLYDDSAAPLMRSIIDCEPIYFTYGKKDWMIELWKGQYGIETGCEIGVYNRDSGITDVRDAVMGKFFKCVDNDDRLTMSFVLKKNGVKLFERGPEVHWWLTGFKWGEFTSNPSNDLTMDISIVLKNSEMRVAFLGGLKGLGYIDSNVDINSTANSVGSVTWDNSKVMFTFGVPKSQQPKSKTDDFNDTQAQNKALASVYNSIKEDIGLSSNDPNLFEESLINKLSSESQDAYNKIVNWFDSTASTIEKLIKS